MLVGGSIIPSLPRKTDKTLSSVTFETKDIEKNLQSLDPHKAHGHDMISIRMLKTCGISICKRLGIIYKACIEKGKFPSEWKKANNVPVHKNGDKQLFKNYRVISLLPICGKILEHLLYNKMLEFLLKVT